MGKVSGGARNGGGAQEEGEWKHGRRGQSGGREKWVGRQKTLPPATTDGKLATNMRRRLNKAKFGRWMKLTSATDFILPAAMTDR